MGGRTPGDSPQGRRLFLLSRQQTQRDVRALGDVDFVHRLSCGENPRRHDDAEPGNAEGTDLFRMPREIGGIAAACAGRERTMRGLSRCPQQRATNVAADGGWAAAFGAKTKVRLTAFAYCKPRSAISVPQLRFVENGFRGATGRVESPLDDRVKDPVPLGVGSMGGNGTGARHRYIHLSRPLRPGDARFVQAPLWEDA